MPKYDRFYCHEAEQAFVRKMFDNTCYKCKNWKRYYNSSENGDCELSGEKTFWLNKCDKSVSR